MNFAFIQFSAMHFAFIQKTCFAISVNLKNSLLTLDVVYINISNTPLYNVIYLYNIAIISPLNNVST